LAGHFVFRAVLHTSVCNQFEYNCVRWHTHCSAVSDYIYRYLDYLCWKQRCAINSTSDTINGL